MSSDERRYFEIHFRRAIDGLREKSAVLRRFGADAQATAVDACAVELESWFQEWWEEELTVAEAASEAGLTRSAVEKRLASGRWLNAGRRYRPRVRRGDLYGSTSRDIRTESRHPSNEAEALIDDVLSAYEDTTCDQ